MTKLVAAVIALSVSVGLLLPILLIIAELVYPSGSQREWIRSRASGSLPSAKSGTLRRILSIACSTFGLAAVVVIEAVIARRLREASGALQLQFLIAIAAACPGMYVGAMLKLFADSRVQGAFVGAAIAVVIAWWFWMVRILLEAIL